MKALLLGSYDGAQSLKVVEKSVPVPGHGEVLIKVLGSPLNPSDAMFCRGLYGIKKPLPTIPGFEASGTVVKSGGGWLANRLAGKRVACASSEGDGFWAEYALVKAPLCIPLSDKVDEVSASCAIVNPITAYAHFENFCASGSGALVQTAAASQLGQMLIRLAAKKNKKMVNIVHRPGLVQSLHAMGAENVLDSSQESFEAELQDICEKLGARMAVDAVAGNLTGILAKAMPAHSHIILYGALSEQPLSLNPGDLFFKDITVSGFWLNKYMMGLSLPGRLLLAARLNRLLTEEFRTSAARRLTLEEAAATLHQFEKGTSTGKSLIVP